MSEESRLTGTSRSTSSSNICQVLLIEDDEIDRLTVLRAINYHSNKYQCDHVSHLLDAEPLLREKRYDIIVTDMNLPDSTGIDTITTVLGMVDKLPVIVLSGTNDDDIALEAIHSGAQDFIPKDYIKDSALINRTLRHAIERHQLKLGLEATRDREHFLAHYDQCTKLPNRLLFIDRLYQSLVHAQRENDQFSILFMDLDRFKNVNDSIGHSAGDEVLRSIGKRLEHLLRESDTVARFGGDEFVMILHKTHETHHLEEIVNKIIESVNTPIPFGRHLCSVGASVGIATFPQDGNTPDMLLKHADMAMYEAKEKGRNQFCQFTQTLFEKKNQSFSQEKALREALLEPDKHFTLYFQPRINLSDNTISSVEALIRWHHPLLGDIVPDQFIPLAEDLGLVEKIDEWVFEAACKKIVSWKEKNRKTRIGINISGRSFNKSNFVHNTVSALLNKYHISGHQIEIEITEGVLLKDFEHVKLQLSKLKLLGINIAIDDFGTGFSSLGYLSNLPIDTLKIDGSFICDRLSERSDQSVLKAIIGLGEALDLTVVAECIETDEQRMYLKSLNCNEGQGFFWAKPSENWVPDNLALRFSLAQN